MTLNRAELEVLQTFLYGLSATILALDDPEWEEPSSAQFLKILDGYLGEFLKSPKDSHLVEPVRELREGLDMGLRNFGEAKAAARLIREVFPRDDN